MEPVSLATTVVGLITPYLMKVGEGIAKKATDEAWNKAQSLYEILKKKFSGNAYAQETLKRVEEKPRSESRKTALVALLEEKFLDDPSFASKLEKMVSTINDLPSGKVTQTVKVYGNAKTGNITTIGKIDGNVNLSSKKERK